ncbi:hydroxyproline O-galactosyltransferase GALT3 [Punica granatum]|uniref:Hydroxyproline O-galactosyltransferase GALT3 n=2 Tax=Punica granatum TaxID=22663 RepID=A0A6P8DW52_PUNGR|nr:hydroxyproline O-galactosyltransferase GALT3 [Punica granatum]XP_031396503.1 hydroxyproline O-galactosyltransferase GALT3 [Punica granatum]
MKKWSGGMMIVALAMILVFRYCSLVGTKVTKHQKQSAYNFFNKHPPSGGSTGSARSSTREIQKPVKRPSRVNFEGLDFLYAPKNVSADDYKALLVWAQMRILLSRSDALPETAKGIKEASVAWKDLYSEVNTGKPSIIKTVNEEDRNCPPFVSGFFGTNSSGGVVLQIPCGLIEDSSITLVGIPEGGHGSFQVNFIGSQVSGEGEPPVVLHYNVSLPGENMTEQPFILQNTWSNESGWGKEERCPAHGSISSLRVDGLALCNQEVVRGPMEDNANLSHSKREISTNVSGGSAHASENFPFAEGSLFTATIWPGLEGFHLTVNGRQEASLPYRENLEPWSVGEVRIGGNLNLLSAIAKGLPVSEDHDLVVDLDRLKAPVVSRKRLLMLIGVFSTGNNFERRMALRRSWMQYESVRSGDVAVRFFIGLHKNKQVNLELWKEAQAYGDIQFMPFVDYYSLISYKTVAICIMGTKVLPAKYIMKTDDDAFVRIDEMILSLKQKPSNGLLYGLISFESSPDRDKNSKWYISNEEWSKDKYPPWAHGPGYIISRDIAKFIVKGHQEGDLQLFKLEDVAMGIWIEHFKSSGQEVHYINDERFYNAGCEPQYILAHYQGPRKVLCLWETLQKQHKPNCCE